MVDARVGPDTFGSDRDGPGIHLIDLVKDYHVGIHGFELGGLAVWLDLSSTEVQVVIADALKGHAVHAAGFTVTLFASGSCIGTVHNDFSQVGGSLDCGTKACSGKVGHMVGCGEDIENSAFELVTGP